MSGPDPFWWRDGEAPSGPRAVEGGIQINSARGAVGRTWWSQRFLDVLESLGVGGRLARGKTYARKGQIISLDVGPGAATAQVQGSREQPYAVRVGVPAFGKSAWSQIAQALAEDASYAAALLGGEMPASIESVFDDAGMSLFPASPRDLALDCTCPDHAVPCKHLAAVCYVLAERFDSDPFQILTLRGRDRATLLADLRERRAAIRAAGAGGRVERVPPAEVPAPAPPGEPTPESPLAADPAAFWTAPRRTVPAGPRIPPDTLLDQVPPFPISVGDARLADVLRPLYRALGADVRDAESRAGESGGGARPVGPGSDG